MKKEGILKQLILSAILPLMIVGCNMEEDIDKPDVTGNMPLTVTTTVVDDDVATRGLPINTESQMTDLGFFCSYTGSTDWDGTTVCDIMYNRQMVRKNGMWDYAPGDDPVTWGNDSAADRYSFFAYAPFATSDNGLSLVSGANTPGTPVLRYCVPEDATKQPDLMIARSCKDIYPTGNPVGLQMKHALTSVGFELSGQGAEVVEISIKGIIDEASIVMDTLQIGSTADTLQWTDLGAPTDVWYEAKLRNMPVTATPSEQNPLANDGFLMMIPQTLTSAAQVKISFSNGSEKILNLTGESLHSEWKTGKKVIYSIIL